MRLNMNTLRKVSAVRALSACLAIGFAFSPALALADGVIQLKPLRDGSETVYNGYSANNYNGGNTLPDYGSGYYAPDSNTTLRGRLVSIPKGTLMSVNLSAPISTYAAHVGSPVSATLENDVYINDAVAIPAGSEVLGQVANVSPAGRLGKHGEVDVRFDSIKLPDNRVIPVRASIVTKDNTGILKGDTYTMDVVKGVGIAAGATGVGTLMGTAAGSLLGATAAGAVFGLGVGALGGMGYAVARKGKEVTIPSGSRMSVVIDTPVTVNY